MIGDCPKVSFCKGRYEFAVSLISYWPRRNVSVDKILIAFRELQAAIHRRFEAQLESHAYLHVLLSNQIKIGHATVWIRTRVCASFILRPSLLPFGFAPWFARILRETFAEKPNDAPSSLSVIKKEASALLVGDT